MSSQTIIDTLNRPLEAEPVGLEYYHIHTEAIPQKEIAEGIWGILPAEENHAMSLARRIRELVGIPIEPRGPATTRGKELGEKSKNQGILEMQREQEAIKDYSIGSISWESPSQRRARESISIGSA